MLRLAWIGCLIGFPLVWAEAQSPFFRHYPLGDAFPGVRCEVVYQSPDRFIWIGSNKGLFRYDGWAYTPYSRSDSLSVKVTAIFQDKNCTLWVGYEDGKIFHLNWKGDMKPWTQEGAGLQTPIKGFAEDNQGGLWIATYGEGLFVVKEGRLQAREGISGKDIYCLLADPEGNIWMGTDLGVDICTPSGEVRHMSVADGIIREMALEGSRRIWLGAFSSGVYTCDLKTMEITQAVGANIQSPITSLAVFEGREVWIGTENKGLFRHDIPAGVTRPVSTAKNDPAGKIFDLLRDLEGNMWVLSSKPGISSTNRQFEMVDASPGPIQALIVHSSGVLWVGTPQGLFETLPGFQFRKVLGINVVSLYEDPHGNIWAGAFDEGVTCLNPATGRVRRIGLADGLANGSVLSIDGTADRVWLATLGGVTEFELAADPLEGGPLPHHSFDQESGLGTNFVYKVFADSKNRVWFGTDGQGISVLENGRIANYPKAEGVALQAVYSITEDRAGRIWLSTAKEGIFSFDGESFRRLAFKEGLRDLAITGLATDYKGNILIVHPSGVDLLDPETGHLIYFDEAVGIEDFEPNLNAVCKGQNGQIWIADQDGLIQYTPLQEFQSIHPQTVLTGVWAFPDAIDFSRVNTFSYFQNHLVFDYIGLWYTDPQAVEYHYKLEGFDRDWITSRDHRVVYSNLPPGKYVFQLRSTENAAFQDEPMVAYSFEIQAPFWKQPLFIVGAVAVGALLLIGFIRFRDQRIRRMAELEREKIESQYEALKSQINPHFLFNSFNTLAALIEENPKGAVEYVEQISDFYRSILQYREKNLIALEEELGLVRNYVYLLEKRFGSHLALVIDVAAGGSYYVAPLTVQMLVENAVKHNVISRSRPLFIEIRIEEGAWLSVCNNLQKKTSPAPSTGFGLESIVHRYGLMTTRKVQIEESQSRFCVRIPLLHNGDV